jgi:hypothetical protein
MEQADQNQFEKEVTCTYRNETYSVRDNGAIFRHRRIKSRLRPLDEKWTFGNPCKQKGYLNFSSETVHRIVATAFHGCQPSEKHIVDHIDTNKKNNRPENLRWVTRLDNILLNPITLSRIIYKYGSIDKFFTDPSKPQNGVLDQNFEWMRSVSKEESESTKNNLLNWAKDGKIPIGGSLGEWIFSDLKQKKDSYIEKNTLIQSLTPNAIQKKWKTKCEFPNCPNSIDDNTLNLYKERLFKGKIFSINDYGESVVENSEINENTNELLVMTNSENLKPYALAKVYIDEDNFIHESIQTFFTFDGAQKQFNLAAGIEWEGEDSIDDYL